MSFSVDGKNLRIIFNALVNESCVINLDAFYRQDKYLL